MSRVTETQWTVADAQDLYGVDNWGQGYFSVADSGHIHVHPGRDRQRSVDLKELVDRLKLRGLDLPVLVRFDGIVRDRLRTLHDAFVDAIRRHDYQAGYSCVYPIKVNQQRSVVERVVDGGREFGFGLEAGSKPELLAVVAMTSPDTPIICNGFKDRQFIRMALLARKMGRNVIPVVERVHELRMILDEAELLGIRPAVGMRAKLAARGTGRWQSTSGYQSKFGLRLSEVSSALAELQTRGLADCFQLLHFHLGSQISSKQQLNSALSEASRVYCELRRQGAGLCYLDVGGGLGVDYDGSRSDRESSMDYSLREYANTIVERVQSNCDEAGVPHPHLISESGRAVSAFHSVLVFDVLGVSRQDQKVEIPDALPDAAAATVVDLATTLEQVSPGNLLESFHVAQQAIDLALNQFATGQLPFEQRLLAEDLYYAICRRIWQHISELDLVPDELAQLKRLLSENYFCNFSVFQSLPDSWAINQLFPVMPIHRLSERPDRHAVLSDLTCDSDGRIDQFPGFGGAQDTLTLHAFDGTPYYLGVFLVGAYQEVLSAVHNLFGDTNAAHVDLTDSGDVVLEFMEKGQSVREVLDHVQFNSRELIHRLQLAAETSIQQGLIDHRMAGQIIGFYEEALNGYTYLGAE